jgi:hypothetical protein
MEIQAVQDQDVAPSSRPLSSRARVALSVAMAALGVVALVPRPAEACGSSARFTASPLLPLADATGVPTNAVLLASSSSAHHRPHFELREAESSRVIPVAVACEIEAGVEVCTGRPGPLAPRTRYLWSAHLNHLSQPASTRAFTTGEGPDLTLPLAELPPPGPTLQVEVLEQVVKPNLPCGMSHRARMRFTVPDLDEPLAIVVAGMGGYPHVFEDPVLLTPAATSIDVTLYGALSCLAVRLIDAAGNTRHFAPWCPPSAGTGAPSATTEAGAGDQKGGCAAGGGASSSPWTILPALVLLFSRALARGRIRLQQDVLDRAAQ